MGRFRQGKYTPLHPEKYIGDVDNIVYRSSWELKMNKFLDMNPNVLQWGSECLAIPYLKPTDNKIHRYFPDYIISYKNTKGQLIKELIEVKPHAQTKAPKRKKGNAGLYESVTYAVNIKKWQAASKWCKERGIRFRIITEKEMFK